MSAILDTIFDRAFEHLDREGRRLESIDRSAATMTFDHDGFSAINRALSYVVMGGVLEEFMREFPQALASEVALRQIERRELPVSLLAAIDAALFRQCSSDGVSALMARADIVQTMAAHNSDARVVSDFGSLLALQT
ncbi:hypothetical protein [Kribbella caucasensis]|uniref:hypothetical protein n=1 Tax=Kribbella caucasensis TaxID=2512215 RepID=UPI00105FA03D|nr:hypothetical protein [Kribbella sp. VKM Ac-2527]